MYVGFENMRDRHPIFARHGDVNVAIRPGVENSGDPFLVALAERANDPGMLMEALFMPGVTSVRIVGW